MDFGRYVGALLLAVLISLASVAFFGCMAESVSQEALQTMCSEGSDRCSHASDRLSDARLIAGSCHDSACQTEIHRREMLAKYSCRMSRDYCDAANASLAGKAITGQALDEMNKREMESMDREEAEYQQRLNAEYAPATPTPSD